MAEPHLDYAGGRLRRGDPAQGTKAGLSVGRAVALGASLVLSALLMALAIASPKWSWLGWISVLPVFLAVRVLPPRSAMIAGGTWGLCLYLSSVVAGDTFPQTIQSIALLAAVPALYVGLGAWLTRRLGFNPLILALGWVGVELILGPLGVHQGLLAGPQSHGPLAEFVGRLLGYAFVAFLVAFVSALLLSIASDMRLPGGQPRYIPRSDDERGWIVPRTFPCLSLIAVRPAHPRAPPEPL